MKLPFERQQDLKDCGVSCLLMIIKYYHGNIPREKLRELTKTTKEGTTAYDLIEAAKKLYFSSQGVTGNIEELKNSDLPCIAHVTIGEKYQHYVVIYKKNHKKLLIADPASSLKVVSIETFKKMTTNVYILFTPQKKIPNIKLTNELKSFILTFLSTYKKQFIFLLLFSIFIFCFQLLNTLQVKFLLEYVIFFEAKSNLVFYLTLFIGVTVLKAYFQMLQFSLTQELNQRFSKTLHMKVFQHFLSLPYLYYRNHSTGEIMTRILELEKLENAFFNGIFILFVELPIFILVFSFLGVKKIEIIFLMLTFLSFTIIFLTILENFGILKLRDARQKSEEVNSYLTETILGIEVVKSFNYQKKFQNKYLSFYKSFGNSKKAYLKNWNFQEEAESMIASLFKITLLIFCTIEVLKKNMTVGDLIFYEALSIYLLEPVKHFLSYRMEYREAKESWKKIGELLEIPKEALLPYPKKKNLKIENIQLDNISYSYNTKRKVLNGISLEMKKGDKILIYGESGGGKSTLGRLITKLLEPDDGRIKINGCDIKNYSPYLIREKIMYVPQKGYLFTTTVLENICFEEGQEIFEKTLDAGKLCMVDEIVEEKMEGYHYLLEENGYNLSGGERQRIILARAIVKNAAVYIFDESLSELDPEKERQILKNLFLKYPEKIMMIISHRERNQDLYTRIIKLTEGKNYEEN